jgi:acylphosphatase
MHATVRLTIHGVVQGVGYRAWMCATARRLGVNGWVRNRADGTVEALVGGAEQAVSEILRLCREGPPAARVSEILIADVSEPPPPVFHNLPTV